MAGRGGAAANVVSLHARGGSSATARSYPARTPVLVLEVAGTRLTLGTSDTARVSASDVAFARLLAEQAQAFAVACERMFRGLPTDPQ
ncbi:hypothetical protein HDA32_001457 [Spinactinospora alkalitolerans]|uniref:Uncharacterized protein n=1 Tax=Spinactinospora alkalitolerans TaxID=687207 RepID=A0A852TSS8_9ACTN|nr:hypothetical protein [Spinactinospora alkalitolerans]NYE46337.1 hypothetical protein [Spinactinospora alkalitolerans]